MCSGFLMCCIPRYITFMTCVEERAPVYVHLGSSTRVPRTYPFIFSDGARAGSFQSPNGICLDFVWIAFRENIMNDGRRFVRASRHSRGSCRNLSPLSLPQREHTRNISSGMSDVESSFEPNEPLRFSPQSPRKLIHAAARSLTIFLSYSGACNERPIDSETLSKSFLATNLRSCTGEYLSFDSRQIAPSTFIQCYSSLHSWRIINNSIKNLVGSLIIRSKINVERVLLRISLEYPSHIFGVLIIYYACLLSGLFLGSFWKQ